MADHDIIVGIDVSKHHLDIAIDGQLSRQRVANTPASIETLIGQFAQARPHLVVVEATGGYELASVRACKRLVLRWP